MDFLTLFFLLIIGLILILIEILFIPGTTVFGIFGILAIFYSDYLSFQYFGTEFAIVYSIANSILVLFVVIYSLKTNTWKKIALNKIHNVKVENKFDSLKVGDEGKTTSALRPYGKAIFSDKFYEVKSSENFIDENKKIKIINILQDKIIVKKIK
tara:strand:+ start:854 stop:1318 length:465 start_codon:yes stop_codon:yes gene_type:complete